MRTESKINISHIFDSEHLLTLSSSQPPPPQSLPGTSLTLLCSKRPERKSVVWDAFVHPFPDGSFCFVIQSDDLEMTKLQNASRKFNKCALSNAKGAHYMYDYLQVQTLSLSFPNKNRGNPYNKSIADPISKNPQKLWSTVHPRTRWTCHCEVLRLLKIHTYLEGAKTWSLTEVSMTRYNA